MQTEAAAGDTNAVTVTQQLANATNQGWQNTQTTTNGIIQTVTTDITSENTNMSFFTSYATNMLSVVGNVNSLMQSGKL